MTLLAANLAKDWQTPKAIYPESMSWIAVMLHADMHPFALTVHNAKYIHTKTHYMNIMESKFIQNASAEKILLFNNVDLKCSTLKTVGLLFVTESQLSIGQM